MKPFKILEKIGTVAYRVALPSTLSGVHNVFHVSMLRKCVLDPDQIVELQPLCLEKNLTYAEYPEKILGIQDKKLRNCFLRFLKIQWSHHSEHEATWELESEMRKKISRVIGTLLNE